jgi:hypothetical protein
MVELKGQKPAASGLWICPGCFHLFFSLSGYQLVFYSPFFETFNPRAPGWAYYGYPQVTAILIFLFSPFD